MEVTPPPIKDSYCDHGPRLLIISFTLPTRMNFSLTVIFIFAYLHINKPDKQRKEHSQTTAQHLREPSTVAYNECLSSCHHACHEEHLPAMNKYIMVP